VQPEFGPALSSRTFLRFCPCNLISLDSPPSACRGRAIGGCA
jgi:hypothetical protein